jgi:hypothetical protein
MDNPKAGYLALQGAIDKSGSAEISEFDIFDKKNYRNCHFESREAACG